jgi:hypothetical protein
MFPIANSDQTKRKLPAPLVLVIAFLLAALIYWAYEFQIDRCLDAGGRWNYPAASCEQPPAAVPP